MKIPTKRCRGIVMRYSVAVRVSLVAIMICASSLLTHPGIADDGKQLLTVDHYVSVRSTAPSMSVRDSPTIAVAAENFIPVASASTDSPGERRTPVLPFFRCAALEAVPRERALEVSPPREC
jgi:hypothetical protein